MLKVRAPYSITSIRLWGKVRQVRDETRVHDGTGAGIASITAGVQGMVVVTLLKLEEAKMFSARGILSNQCLAVGFRTATSRSFAAISPRVEESGETFSVDRGLCAAKVTRSRSQEQIMHSFNTHSLTRFSSSENTE
jgi:hypothetical protein